MHSEIKHRAVFDTNRVQFSSRNRNELLDDRTAWLILEGTLFGGEEFSCIEVGDLSITAPDGLAHVAESGRVCVYPSDSEHFAVTFKVEEPIPGAYEVEIREDNT